MAEGAAPNYESGDTLYTVSIEASDGELADTAAVTIRVTNAHDPGKTTLSAAVARVGVQLTATLMDQDISIERSKVRRWQRSDDGASSWTSIAGARIRFYTPEAADRGKYLRAVFTYADGLGPNNVPPAFGADSYERAVAENSAAGAQAGAAVTATDGNADDLAYGFVAGGDEALFEIDGATGQITVAPGAALDYESGDTLRAVSVEASDGELAHTAAVTIRVTNADDAGMIALIADVARVGEQLTATLMDQDGSRRQSVRRKGANTRVHTPEAADEGKYLRAVLPARRVHLCRWPRCGQTRREPHGGGGRRHDAARLVRRGELHGRRRRLRRCRRAAVARGGRGARREHHGQRQHAYRHVPAWLHHGLPWPSAPRACRPPTRSKYGSAPCPRAWWPACRPRRGSWPPRSLQTYRRATEPFRPWRSSTLRRRTRRPRAVRGPRSRFASPRRPTGGWPCPSRRSGTWDPRPEPPSRSYRIRSSSSPVTRSRRSRSSFPRLPRPAALRFGFGELPDAVSAAAATVDVVAADEAGALLDEAFDVGLAVFGRAVAEGARQTIGGRIDAVMRPGAGLSGAAAPGSAAEWASRTAGVLASLTGVPLGGSSPADMARRSGPLDLPTGREAADRLLPRISFATALGPRPRCRSPGSDSGRKVLLRGSGASPARSATMAARAH